MQSFVISDNGIGMHFNDLESWATIGKGTYMATKVKKEQKHVVEQIAGETLTNDISALRLEGFLTSELSR